MNEMQLFEVGLSEEHQGGYWLKYYVIATDDLDARSKARRFAVLEAEKDEGDFENEGERQNYLDIVANLTVTRNQHLGKVIV